MEGKLKLGNKVNLDLERSHPSPEDRARGRGRGLPLWGGRGGWSSPGASPHPGALIVRLPQTLDCFEEWATRVTSVSQNTLLAPGVPRPCQVCARQLSASRHGCSFTPGAGPPSPFSISGLCLSPTLPKGTRHKQYISKAQLTFSHQRVFAEIDFLGPRQVAGPAL